MYKNMTISEYKQKYYIKNIDKYNARNLKASIERSEELRISKLSDEQLTKEIENMSTDEIIYKLNYILLNEPIKKSSPILVQF